MNRGLVRRDAGAAGTRQFATVKVGECLLGIAVEKVREVMRPQEMTDVPLAAPAIRGLINLRGQIVMSVDTRMSLGLEAAPEEQAMRSIILRSEEGGVSLLVDDIGDVLDVPVEAFAPVPDNMPEMRRELIDGVYNLDNHLLLVLNTEKLLEKACR
ncbi:chemotaxis protein CheW [Silvibacterium dinghuense]|uniref:chemotaxis protein CheW n=1 Tax=Silvibacterium dinghuense TaxID=1560006 RepID=UPI00195F19A9|nr:chemotaxis protein CheW [Silvibacterium dinghuense]